MAPPKAGKTATQQASEARLARAWAAGGLGRAAAQPGSASRATSPPRITSAVRDRDRGRSAMSQIRSSVNSSP